MSEPKFKPRDLVRVAHPDPMFTSEGFRQWHYQVGFIEDRVDTNGREDDIVYAVKFTILEPLTMEASQKDGTWHFYQSELELVSDETD